MSSPPRSCNCTLGVVKGVANTLFPLPLLNTVVMRGRVLNFFKKKTHKKHTRRSRKKKTIALAVSHNQLSQ